MGARASMDDHEISSDLVEYDHLLLWTLSEKYNSHGHA
jgi:hypothetical protein